MQATTSSDARRYLRMDGSPLFSIAEQAERAETDRAQRTQRSSASLNPGGDYKMAAPKSSRGGGHADATFVRARCDHRIRVAARQESPRRRFHVHAVPQPDGRELAASAAGPDV